jgi:hypothetical protein
MLHLETVEILPALVLGFEPETGDWEKIREITGTPPWLHIIEQQAGGLSMSYPEVFGVILRFAANPAKGKPGLAEVMRAFEAMAADPDLELLRSDFPELVGLYATWGEPYNTAALKCLHDCVNNETRR